jgi:hypothetical protein
VTDIGECEPAVCEASFECGDAARRPAVEERGPVLGLEEVTADDPLGTDVVKVDQVGDPAIVAGSSTKGFMLLPAW